MLRVDVTAAVRAALLAVVTLACLLLPTRASAQTVTLASTGFEIIRNEPRPSGYYPYSLNRKDCIEDDADFDGVRTTIRMQPNVTGVTGNNTYLEIWVTSGDTDCSSQDNRTASNRLCAKLASKKARIANPEIYLSPRDVMTAIADRTVDFSGSGASGQQGPEICDANQNTSVAFWLLLIDSSDVLGSPETWTETSIDTAAPPAPTALTASGGDQRVFLDWTVATEDEDTDTQGFTFFCEPIGSGAPVSTSNGGNGGQGGEAPAAIGCSSAPSRLIEGERLPDDLRCGYATGRSVRNGQIDDLENYTEYAVAVTAADQLNNEGVLSEVQCATPEEVITFFDQYRNDGGQGGGGYCSIDWKRGGTPTGLVLFVLGLLGARTLRRRRRAC